MTLPNAPRADYSAIVDALRRIPTPDAVVELRVLHTQQGTVSGLFDPHHRDLLAKAAVQWSGRAPGVYITLNPINPTLLARSANHVTSYVKNTTSDADIVRRKRLGIDFDAVRPAGLSSTDAEHEAAIARAREAREWLTADGWPLPILADSGNGAHLTYAVDMPNAPESTETIRQCLRALAFRFNDERVAVDETTYNSGRIWKLYGTVVCKGDNVADRPHRVARILEAPDVLEVVR